MTTGAPKDGISRVAIRDVVWSTQTFKFEDITDEFKDRLVILWPQAPGEDHWQTDFSVHPDARELAESTDDVLRKTKSLFDPH